MSALDPNPDTSMHDHPLVDIATVIGAAVVATLTSEKTLIFVSICFTAYRWYLAWKKRNDHRELRDFKQEADE